MLMKQRRKNQKKKITKTKKRKFDVDDTKKKISWKSRRILCESYVNPM
jgi:hypothetical protein